jgi:hypothetical protein
MKHLIAALTLTLSTQAFAETTGPEATTPATTPATTVPGQIWVGAAAQLASPSSDGIQGQSKVDFDAAYALMATADYQLNNLISLRAMPRYVLHLKDAQSMDSSSAYDLRVGATVGKDVMPKIRAYGLAALGYSSISFASQGGGSSQSASGATLTIGAGGTYAIGPKMRLYAEAAYELGFQSISEGGQTADYKVNFLDFGAGLQIAVGGK